MVKLGPCTIVIEPHHFDAVMYAVRDPQSRPVHTPQANRPIVQYTHPTNPSNFHQYQPRTPANQPRIITPYPPNSNAPPQPPPNPPPHRPAQTPSQPLQNHDQPKQGPPVATAASPPQAGAPIAAAPASGAPDPNAQGPRPSLDPVIQMLAARAASNPDLKALMRVVASTKANQEQLRAFQAHIDELNAIIASRQGEQQNPQGQQGQHNQQSPPITPAPTTTTQAPQGHGIFSPNPGTPTSGPQPTQQVPLPNPPSVMYPRPPQPQPPPIRSKNPQHGPPHMTYFQHQPHTPVSKQQEIKAVVFEFVPPAGSTPAVHGATGDRYLFPVNTILDYFPGRTTVIASFLATKKFDPNAPLSESSGNQPAGKAKGKKGKTVTGPGTPAPATPAPKDLPSQAPGPQGESKLADGEKSDTKPKTNPNIKEYYQPVTMSLHGSQKVLEPLARVVRPADQVRDHMNDIMDRMERADIEYLAMRLPREKPREDNPVDEVPNAKTPRGNGNNHSVGKARVKEAVPDIPLTVKVEEEEEEELKDFYGLPSGLVPLR